MAQLRILILEDYEPDSALIEAALRRGGMTVQVRLVSDEPAFLEALEACRPDAILSDYAIPGFTGLQALRFVRDHGLDMPFILITGSQTEETVAECFKFGADDYLLKSNLTRLPAALRHSLQRRRAERERGEAIVRLRDRERRLAEAQAIAHLGSWELGLGNLENLSANPLWWSDETYRIFGYDPGTTPASSQAFFAVIPPNEQGDVEQAIRHAARDGGSYEVDHRVVRLDGSERIVRERATVERDDTGRPLRMVGTVLDITDLKRAEEELRRSREELRVLARGLQSVREEERERMAREIHDELGQALTAIKMDLMWIVGRLPTDQWSLTDRMHALVRTTDSAGDAVRRIASKLRPGVLDDLGLIAAIEWVVEDFARRTSIHVATDLPQIPPRVDRELATALFRILQESLTNVARHAAARRVQVRLWVQDDEVFLEVRDDGRGVQTDPAELPRRRALGVLGMRERAGALGGDISVTGGPGKGTTVLARVPLRPPQ